MDDRNPVWRKAKCGLAVAFIRKRDGRWQVRYNDPSGRERGRSFDKERDAKRFKAEIETELARDEWMDPTYGRVTFREWQEVWVKNRVVGVRTRETEAGVLRQHLVPRFGDVALSRITTMSVRTMVAELEQLGRKPATIAKVYQVLRKILQAAVEEGFIRTNPCRNVRMPAGGVDERVFLTADQVGALLPYFPRRYRALVLTTYTSGARWSEMAGLRRPRVQFPERLIEIAEVAQESSAGRITFGPPKTKASRRRITLPAGTIDALRAHLENFPPGPDGLVFTGSRGGPLSRTRFRQRVWLKALALLEAADDAAGRPRTNPVRPRFHHLRHSHAAALIADNVHPKAIQQRLGHGSIRVTFDIYGHLLPDVDETVIAGLEVRFAGLHDVIAEHPDLSDLDEQLDMLYGDDA